MAADEHFIALDGQESAPVEPAPENKPEVNTPSGDEHFIPPAAAARRSGQVEMHHPGLDRTVWLPKGQARIMEKSGWVLVDNQSEGDEPEPDGT